MSPDEAFRAAAEGKLLTDSKREGKEYEVRLKDAVEQIEGMNGDLLPLYFRVPGKTTLSLSATETVEVLEGTTLGEVARVQLHSESKAQDLLDRNIGTLIVVPAGTKLKLPGNHQPPTYEVKQPMKLGEVAAAALGQADRALKLYEANRSLLTPKISLPAGTQIKVPQLRWPALASFGVLVLLLIIVGLGWMLRSDPMTGSDPTAGAEFGADRSAADA
jgi:hypothetical protein